MFGEYGYCAHWLPFVDTPFGSDVESGGMNWFETHAYIAQWVGPFVTLFAVLVAIYLPRRLTRRDEQRERPRLKLKFDPGEPFVRTTKVDGGKNARWRRVKVTNVGKRPARRCIGMVTHVSTLGDPRNDIDPMQLRWAGVPRSRGFDGVDLAPDGFAYLNVLVRQDGEDVIRFDTFSYNDGDYDPGFETFLRLAGGEHHEVTVTVTSDTAEPASIVLDIRD